MRAATRAARVHMSELLALLDVPLEAAPRADGGRRAVGDGDAGETARLASRARQGASGTPGRTVASRLLLEVDADTAARGILERLLGLVSEVVVVETVNIEKQSGYTVREQACQRAG